MHFVKSIDFLMSGKIFMLIKAIAIFQFKTFTVSLEAKMEIFIE
jgi:hypothetical protein